jgi:hypothetical protein
MRVVVKATDVVCDKHPMAPVSVFGVATTPLDVFESFLYARMITFLKFSWLMWENVQKELFI